jgi:hypothetical protein
MSIKTQIEIPDSDGSLRESLIRAGKVGTAEMIRRSLSGEPHDFAQYDHMDAAERLKGKTADG